MRKNNDKHGTTRTTKPNTRGNNSRGGKQRNRNSFYTDREGADEYDPKRSRNDEAWYGADPAILRDAASIPFSASIGTSLDYGSQYLKSGNPYFTKGLSHAIPGLINFKITPSFGYAHSGNDPINVAANAIYAFLRQANSGAKNYDAPDMMLYCLAMTQVYSYISYLQRIYGYVNLYSQRNRYMPKSLVYANLASYEDIMNDLAGFRYGINLLINKASSLAVPGNMTIFQRHAFLYRDVYSEGDSIKDQLYQFVPDGFYKFDFNSDKSGMLKYIGLADRADVTGEIASKVLSVKALLSLGNELLDPLITSEDFNIMSGDILKAYGDNIIKLTSLPTEFPVVPVHDYTVLQQMKNATIIGQTLTSNAVVQDPTKSFLMYKPQVPKAAATSTFKDRIATRAQYANPIISVGSADPTPGEVMEVTRLKATRINDPDNTQTDYINCGTEIVRFVSMQYIDVDTGKTLGEVLQSNTFWTSYNADVQEDNSKQLFRMMMLNNYKFGPMAYVFFTTAEEGDLTKNDYFMGISWDFDNYSVITPAILQKLHEAAIMNMLHVPHISKV
nr:capsid protein [Picobirnavirus sp.]